MWQSLFLKASHLVEDKWHRHTPKKLLVPSHSVCHMPRPPGRQQGQGLCGLKWRKLPEGASSAGPWMMDWRETASNLVSETRGQMTWKREMSTPDLSTSESHRIIACRPNRAKRKDEVIWLKMLTLNKRAGNCFQVSALWSLRHHCSWETRLKWGLPPTDPFLLLPSSPGSSKQIAEWLRVERGRLGVYHDCETTASTTHL